MELVTTVLPYVQVALAVLLGGAILLQQSTTGAGGALGSGDINAAYHSRRGLEKALFNATIVLAVLFALSAFVALVV